MISLRNKIVLVGGSFVLLILLSVTISSYLGYFSLLRQETKSSCAHYDKQIRAIIVTCDSTLSEVSKYVSDARILKQESTEPGLWLLNSSLVVTKGAQLTINSIDAKWVKISSQGNSLGIKGFTDSPILDKPTPYHIQIFGQLHLYGVKISSWNPLINNYTIQTADGTRPRPYITVEASADPSHIVNSEISHLGYNSTRRQGLGFYGGNHSSLVGNKVHDLWYGFFSSGVEHLTLENNSVYNNLRYGIDIYDGSHNIIVRSNNIDNSRIGLICSVKCSDVLFEKNKLDNNKEVGLMFSKGTINSIARLNSISLSDTGISVSESHSNKAYGNTLLNNSDGLAVKNYSFDNLMYNNIIFHPLHCGIIVILGVQNNTVAGNEIQNYKSSGICLAKGANQNLFYSNELSGLGQYGINIKDFDVVSNSLQNNMIHLSDTAIRVYHSKGNLFINNKIGNLINHGYILSGGSSLNLDRTKFLGETIRATGIGFNTVSISNSGIIDVSIDRVGHNDTVSRYNTNLKPYVGNLAYTTVKIQSIRK
jgi:parallel beta-helix repeat protein